jgi:sugar phosphate isomerase/epimerase
MTLSGIADEAGADLDTQIRAHRVLGWTHIDLRMVDGVPITELDEAAFESMCAQLSEAGLNASSFASGIANWACRIDDPFEHSVDALRRTLPRMRRLGCPYIRTMSYPNAGLPDAAWRDEAVRRLRVLGDMAGDAGVTITVEICDGWASTSPEHYAQFFERVGSPAVRAVFDTGNPASHGFTDTWAWYRHARPFIAYIHIKDHTGPLGDAPGAHTWPGEGIGEVKRILEDLAASAYAGFVSIEPHLSRIIHEGREIDHAERAFETYVAYGRRVEDLVTEALRIRSGGPSLFPGRVVS